MSQENVELVRSIYADWARGDFRSAEWADPGIEYVVVNPGIFPAVSGKGRAALREVARSSMDIFEDVHIEAEAFRELDSERVLVLDRPGGRSKHSGLDVGELVVPMCAHVFHLRHGKVTKLVAYFDRDRALADLGLEE